MTKTTSDFERIVIKELPLIDLRAPIEFEKGTFKNAVNLPLMSDKERHLVGICYKEKGNAEAIKLGHKLVSGEIRQRRITAWVNHLNKYPDSIIFCFRGGQRSQISQEWILEASGQKVTRLEGGYKAFRNYLINALNPHEQISVPILLGGFTGTGKTSLLKKLDNTIDLEGIANHRGSSFGRHINPQPPAIDFENNLAYALIQHKHKNYRFLILEDEGRNIGKCILPKPLAEYFACGDLLLVELPFEERVINTLKEYVILSQKEYLETFGEESGMIEWFNYIRNSIYRIKNRLGGDCFQRVMETFQFAFSKQNNSHDLSEHKKWIEILLKEYYDPMYNYQIKKTSKKILFKGNQQEVLDHIKTHYSDKF